MRKTSPDAEAASYTKDQLLRSKKYAARRDLLGALLDAFWAPAGCALAWAAFLAQLILLLRLRTRWEDGS